MCLCSCCLCCTDSWGWGRSTRPWVMPSGWGAGAGLWASLEHQSCCFPTPPSQARGVAQCWASSLGTQAPLPAPMPAPLTPKLSCQQPHAPPRPGPPRLTGSSPQPAGLSSSSEAAFLLVTPAPSTVLDSVLCLGLCLQLDTYSPFEFTPCAPISQTLELNVKELFTKHLFLAKHHAGHLP